MILDVSIVCDGRADPARLAALVPHRDETMTVTSHGSWLEFGTSLDAVNARSRWPIVPDLVLVGLSDPDFDHRPLMAIMERHEKLLQVAFVVFCDEALDAHLSDTLRLLATAILRPDEPEQAAFELQQIMVCSLMGRNPYPDRAVL